MAVISVGNLKKYFGSTHAVDGISFDVEEGEIFGFLGPNGAGKTTTIRCLMDFIRPTSGKITILGQDATKKSAELKKDIGFLPGNVKLYDGWTGLDHINFLQNPRGQSKILPELLRQLNFNPKIRAKHLSSGNKQKLGLILALMHEPKILIMDEPTVGLDPLLQNTIYDILENFQKKGTTILMSSHNLPEVERLCRRVAIIKEGKLVALESIEDIKTKRMHFAKIYFDGKFETKDFVTAGTEVAEELPGGFALNIKGDINPLIKKLASHKLKDVEISHASLEEIFLEFYDRGLSKKADKTKEEN